MKSSDKSVRIQLERHLWPDEVIARKKRKRSRLILATLCMGTFCLGLLVGLNGLTSKNSISSGNDSFTSSKLNSVYNLMTNNWYFSGNDEQLVDQAIQGMTNNEIDIHTYYMSREEVEAFTNSIDMGFVGIGVQYNSADGANLITRVFHNSPAEAAGVLPGDILYSINGVLCETLTANEITSRVTGIEGTDVTLEFIRDNEIISMTITRAPIQNTAYGEMIKESLGYLQIYQFGSSTGSEVNGYLEMMTEQGLRELIIDLRDDGGGYLDALVSVSSLFLPEKTVAMKQIYADGRVELAYTKKGNFENIEKIVILVNKDTASAAEVLALALKEQRDDVTIIGTTTYGKGTVQITHMFNDGSALKFTTSKWLSPNDVWVNGVGITPDIELPMHDIFSVRYTAMTEEEEWNFDQVSEKVAVAQKALDFLEFPITRTDGYFDKTTLQALTQFQEDFNLSNQGTLDFDTFSTLIAQVTKKLAVDPTSDVQLQKAIEVLHE